MPPMSIPVSKALASDPLGAQQNAGTCSDGSPTLLRLSDRPPASALDGTMPRMAIKAETRKRLWGRSGNRCAKCRAELVRSDEGGLPGALVGEEAHIIARSPGGARYEPLDPRTAG
jgi:hypothetical protein